MCGIAGYIGKQNIPSENIQKTLNLMKNRGPDFQDSVKITVGDIFVDLLHSRLSIIDLDKRSNQPFQIGNYTLIFNGEIYNYIEVRKNLEKNGIEFTTESDTEVLLQSYIEWGEDCVQYFEGMWSFAIFDKKKGRLFLSRDRFAEKPLYYFKASDGFYFASEIKFLKTLSGQQFSINERQLLKYLVQGYKSLYKTSETYYEKIYQISYATNVVINSELQIDQYKYWRPSNKIIENMTLNDALEGTRYYLTESMRLRLRADVPVTFCLSGGVDSAALTSLAAKRFNQNVVTYSIIDSDERYNEYDNIMATVSDINCDHKLLEITRENFIQRLTNLIKYHDSPITTISYYVHSMLSEKISADNYHVVFSGTGADELFTGYYDHFILHLYEMRNHPKYEQYLIDWQNNIARYIRNPVLKDADLYFKNPQYREHIFDNSAEFQQYLEVPFTNDFNEEKYANSLLRNRMLNELFHEAIPVILHEDDLNSMYYSIENRSPYLDTNLFSFAYSIPSKYLIQAGYGKYILREAMSAILNDKVRLDKRKKGFNASINSLINLQDKQIQDYLLDDKANIFQLINRSKIRKLFDLNPAPNHYSKFLFNFINARLFLEMN